MCFSKKMIFSFFYMKSRTVNVIYTEEKNICDRTHPNNYTCDIIDHQNRKCGFVGTFDQLCKHMELSDHKKK